MPVPTTEWIWLDARQTVSVTELASVSGISTAELDELVEYGALAPVPDGNDEQQFQADCVTTLRTVAKLKTDFDLDLFAVALLIGHLRRIEELETRVRSLQAMLAPEGSMSVGDSPEPHWRSAR